MPERNIKQAWVLPSVTTLANPVGTAPGWWAERDGKVIVAMPGVPHEMKRMWEHEVVPRLRDRTGEVLFTRTLRVAGLGESSVEQRLDRSAPQYQSDDRHLCQERRRRRAYQRQGLRLRRRRSDWSPRWSEQAREVLGQHIFGIDQDTPASVVLQTLIERGLSLATMESCSWRLARQHDHRCSRKLGRFQGRTGGLRDRNEGGVGCTGRDHSRVWSHQRGDGSRHGGGGTRAFLGADIGIGVTGVAGPDLQEDKPVGTVHIAVAEPDRVSDTSQHFRGARTEIKWRAAITAINLLRLHLLRGALTVA